MTSELWDFETDVIEKRDYPSTQWAYSLNTDAGQYRMETDSSGFRENSKLMLDTDYESVCIMENITVWPTNYHNLFLIFHSVINGHTFMVDGRGIIFSLSYTRNNHSVWDYGKVEIDKRRGIFIVDGQIEIKYRSPEEQREFEEKSRANSGATFNKEFNRFVRNNAKNTAHYLYLTVGNSKCGALVRYFIENGLEYEMVPNMLCDDDTQNIRVVINETNIESEAVRLLCTKYQNTYSVYGVPISTVGGALSFPPKHKELWYKLGFYMPKGKESIAYSILETLRCACNASDDYDLYKKSFSKILRLFERGSNKECCLMEKDEVQKLESYALSKMANNGVKIGRWTSEADMFTVVKKFYSDAIYQYHAEWLGLQSLDVYIPSLNVAIEYQGEQHFKPVSFFGGEKAFAAVVKRDKRKAKLCNDNGVKLIYWMYDEVISSAQLIKKLNILKNQG